jgi:hypothetical protein
MRTAILAVAAVAIVWGAMTAAFFAGAALMDSRNEEVTHDQCVEHFQQLREEEASDGWGWRI